MDTYLSIIDKRKTHTLNFFYSFSISECKEFGNLLSNDTTLTILDLASVCNYGLEYITQGLQYNSTVEYLDLSQNGLKSRGTLHVIKMLIRNTTLKTLRLRYNLIDDTSGVLLGNASLTQLDLSGNLLGIKSCEVLFRNSSLKILNLYGNHIGDQVCHHIKDVLSSNTTLVVLNLGLNTLGPQSGEILGLVLQSNSTLKHLDLSNNHLGQEGIQLLTRGLVQNSTLTILNIGHNHIGHIGGLEIANMLLHHQPKLQLLDLSMNELSYSACTKIIQSLYGNSTLKSIRLCGNHLDMMNTIELKHMLHQNSTLTHLDLSMCTITPATCQPLLHGLANNFYIQLVELEKNLFPVPITDKYFWYNRCKLMELLTQESQNPRSTLFKFFSQHFMFEVHLLRVICTFLYPVLLS
jgi:hypothetical protein